MSKELVVSSNRHEIRVGVLEDDQLVEIYFQRENEYSLAGSIHKGRVTRVLPGMQSAFVDIGLDRDAFLYVSDFFEDNEEYERVVSSVEDKILRLDKNNGSAASSVAVVPEPEAVVHSEPEIAAPAQEVPAPAPATTVPERGEDRDARRGRRSRRRRTRGRGLPESKYYSPAQRADAPPSETAEAAEEDEDLVVLPGESLAKYSHGPENEGDPEAVTETAALAEPDAHVESEALTESETVPASEPIEEAAAAEAEAVESPATDSEPAPAVAEAEVRQDAAPVQAEEIPATAVPKAEKTEVPAKTRNQQSGRRRSQSGTPAPKPEPAPDVVEPEPAVQLETKTDESQEPVSAEDIEPQVQAEETEPAASAEDIEPTRLATAAEGDTESEETSAVEEKVGEETQPEESADGPEPARIPTSLTAALRDQGSRYLHRTSRRMRRKARGGTEPRRTVEPEVKQEQHRTATRPDPRSEKPSQPSISDLLREGQEIIVQIAKEPLGQKGARITSHIALPGRFLVYMPTVDHIGVSRKISTDDERLRLKRVLQAHRSGIPGGYIVRTAGEGRSEDELRADMMFLYNLWLDIRQTAEKRPAPAHLHHDLDVVQRVLRDQLTSDFKTVWVDNEDVYESVIRFVQRFQPALVTRVKLYTRPTPIFDEFGITSELEKALRPKVWLKSGGYIVINQTEALVAIDINTGKYVGKSHRLEDTIVKTNTDAIREIVRQIRLRDLGGIIVIDFIDMDERKNRQKVMQALEEAMRADRAPYKILQFNDFGLVAITRKRVKQSLERTMCSPCPYCEGAGYVKSVQTVIGEVLQEAHKIARAVEGPDVVLRVNPEVAKVLKSNQNDNLQEIEEILGRNVIVKGDPLLHQEKFDLA